MSILRSSYVRDVSLLRGSHRPSNPSAPSGLIGYGPRDASHEDPDRWHVDLHIFSRCATTQRKPRTSSNISVGGPRCCIASSSSTDFRSAVVVEHGEIARRAPPNIFILPHRDHGVLYPSIVACSSHGRKIVDLYIYEQFGQLLVTVGDFANPIAE